MGNYLRVEKKDNDFLIHQVFSRIESIMTLPLDTLDTLIALLKESKRGIGKYGSLPIRVVVAKAEDEVQECVYIEWHYNAEDACHLGFWVSDRDDVLKELLTIL
mgnify:CR=1 FL=1